MRNWKRGRVALEGEGSPGALVSRMRPLVAGRAIDSSASATRWRAWSMAARIVRSAYRSRRFVAGVVANTSRPSLMCPVPSLP